MPPFSPPQIACLVVVALASFTDLRARKIPNLITFPAAFAGVLMQSWQSGWAGALSALAGWLAGAVVMTLIKLDKMSFGDVKLVAAVGAFLGPAAVLIACFYFSLCFGAVALCRMLSAVRWRHIGSTLAGLRLGVGAQIFDPERLRQMRKQAIPVAPIIALGTALAVLLERQTLHCLGF